MKKVIAVLTELAFLIVMSSCDKEENQDIKPSIGDIHQIITIGSPTNYYNHYYIDTLTFEYYTNRKIARVSKSHYFKDSPESSYKSIEESIEIKYINSKIIEVNYNKNSPTRYELNNSGMIKDYGEYDQNGYFLSISKPLSSYSQKEENGNITSVTLISSYAAQCCANVYSRTIEYLSIQNTNNIDQLTSSYLDNPELSLFMIYDNIPIDLLTPFRGKPSTNLINKVLEYYNLGLAQKKGANSLEYIYYHYKFDKYNRVSDIIITDQSDETSGKEIKKQKVIYY